MKKTYLIRMALNLLALTFITVGIIIYYEGGEFSLPVQIMVVIAIALSIISGYFRLKH